MKKEQSGRESEIPPMKTDDLELENADLRQRINELEQQLDTYECMQEKLQQAQKMLQLVIDAMPQAIFWKDRNLTYLGCNAQFAHDAGLASPDDVGGKSDFDMPWTEQIELFRSDDAYVMQTNTPKYNYEEPIHKADGTDCWLRTSKIPIHDSTGDVVAVLGIYEDITERKHIEHELRLSESRLRTIIENSSDAIVVDNHGIVRFVNPSAEALFDCTSDEIIGHNLGIPVVANTKTEIQILSKNGTYRTAEMRVVAIDWGGDACLMASFRDITERKELEKELEQRVEERTALLQETTKQLQDELEKRRYAEKALRQSEATYRAMFEKNQAIKLLVDPRTTSIVDANPAACAFYGYTLPQMRTMKITAINIHPPAEIVGEIERVVTGERTYLLFKHKLASGIIRDVEVYSCTIEVDGRELLYSIVHDITERRQIEAWLQLTQFSLDRAADAVYWVTEDMQHMYVNDAACTMLGYTREELLRLSILDVDPDLTEEGWSQQWEFLKQAGASTFERTHRCKDGSIFPVEVTANYLKYHDKEYVCGFARDITERIEMSAALRESEERYRLLVSNAPDIIYRYRLSPQYGYEYVSPSVEAILGYAPEAFYADADLAITIVHPDSRPLIIAYRQTPMSYSGPLVIRFIHREGHDVWLELRSTVIFDAAGQPIALEGISRDITDKRRAENELFATNMQLQREIIARKRAEDAVVLKAEALARSNLELEHFAYLASHDLQEPLRMVSSYVQLLAEDYRGKLDDVADEYITYAVDGATRMKQLINDLLDYSRVGTKGKELVPTNSQATLERVLTHLNMTIEESGVIITYDTTMPVVLADMTQLERLFLNLLGNAIKFRCSLGPHVHISSKQQDDWWLFTVEDNGIGIEPQYQERVFQIFQRLHTHTDYPGTGIGLAICKKIVERHGGRIWIESHPGVGTTFFFTLKGA